MKATFTALGAVRSTLEYFLSEAGYAPREPLGPEARARYYAHDTGEHLHASAWFGRGAEALGLTGRVRTRDFERVLRGEVPGTDVVLRRNRDGTDEHRTGWDMTFSAPKSVSVAWGVQGDERVLGECVESVRTALGDLEARHLETRVYDPETKRRKRESADGLVAATFVHVSNRNDEPQLHVHAVVVNMTRSAAGEWRSVEPSALARHARLLGHIAGDALAQRLRALGYALETRRMGRARSFEISGYPRWLLDRFSTRRRELLRHLAETGRRATPRARQTAAFATRADKSGLRTPALRTMWRRQVEAEPRLAQALAAALYRSQRAAPDEAPVPSALETVCAAVEHLAERSTLLRERDILGTALMLAPGRHGPDALEAALERRLRDRHLLPARAYRGGGRAFVATREFADERALVAWMKAARDTGRALAREDAVTARLQGSLRTAGQQAAVRLILLEPHRAVAVQGFAGTGKTAMLREVVGLADANPVFGLAPSAAAARVLGHEAGISARTVDWFLTRFASLRTGEASPATRALARALCGDGLLVVDESSMLSTAQLLALARLTERIGVARVVLCGDCRQLQSVRPGQPFRLLQEAGMPTAMMDEIVRQRNPVIRKAVRDALSGRPARALARLAERIEEVPAQALAETAAREFLALPDAERRQTLLVAPTNALRRDINAVVREGLVEEGRIRGPALVVDRLIDLRLSAPEKAELSSYEPGDEVAFVQDLLPYRVRNAEACVVTGVAGERVALRHPDGTPRHIAPATGRIRYHIKICESAPIELRAGDRIRWTHNDHRRGLLNGETATVARIGKHGVTLRTEGGAKRVLDAADAQLRHIDHAYASTTHAAQGSTCERVIAVLDADPMPLTNQIVFYVQVSRAREEVVLLTDDREQLIETLEEQSGERMSAHEALGATPGGGTAARARRRDYERMRQEWRRVRRRARGERRPERYACGYAAVHAQVARLHEDGALPGYARRFVDDWLCEHTQAERQRQDIETVIRAAQRFGRGPPAGERDDARDDAGATTPGDDGAGEALTLARTIAQDAVAHGPHLEADEDLRKAFETAHRALEAAVFAGAHASVERQATASGRIAFYASGHGALLQHASVLQRSALPLPDETKALAVAVLRDATQRQREARRIARFLACAERRAAARDRDATWTRRDEALHRRATVLAADRGRYTRHFEGDEDLRRRFDPVRAGLETAAFRSAHGRVERQATASGKIAFYAPGHEALVAHATRLEESGLPVDAGTRTLVSGVLRDNATRRGERRRIEAFIAAAQPWEKDGVAETHGDRPGEALLEQSSAMLEHASPWRVHLEGDPTLRRRVDAGCGALQGAALCHDYQTLEEESATRRVTTPFHVSGHVALLGRVQWLENHSVPLPEDAQRVADRVVEEDKRAREALLEIDTFFEDAERRHRERVRGSPWGERDEGLRRRALEMGDTKGPYRAHLNAIDFLPERLERARSVLDAEHDARSPAVTQDCGGKRERACFLDYGPLAARVTALSQSVLETRDSAKAPAPDQASDVPAGADPRRALAEFFEWRAFRELERERESGNDWNALDRALRSHAWVLYFCQTGDDGPPLFDDAESHERVVQAHADLEGQRFSVEDETLRREAEAHDTVPRHRRRYPQHLRLAQKLRDAELPFSGDVRKRIEAVRREEDEHAEEIRQIERFAQDVRDWNERRAPGTQWDEDGKRLLEQGRGADEDISHFREHLAGEERLRTAFATALGTLEGAKCVSEYGRIQALARERRTKPERLKEFRKWCLDAKTLKADKSLILPKSVRERVDEVLRPVREARRDTVPEPQTKATHTETAPATQPGAVRAARGPLAKPHETGPRQEVAPSTQREAGADEEAWLGGLALPPYSAIEAQQAAAMENQARQAEARKRKQEQRKEEQKAAKERDSGPGMGM